MASAVAGNGDGSGHSRINLGIPGYEGISEIGAGGFAVVYRARQLSVNAHVAVKLISRVDLDEWVRRRFDHERSALGRLRGHAHIVDIIDSGFNEKGTPYLVMEYLRSGSLARRLVRTGPLDWTEVVEIGIKLASAIGYAHSQNIIHRDIKPENVLVSPYRQPKLADFGIARLVDSETQSSRTVLSGLHAPPEAFDGVYRLQSDIYSLASTLFSLLTGRPPFYEKGDVVVPILRICTAPVPDLRGEGVPAPVCDVLETALEKQLERRQRSAFEFAEQLQAAQEAAGVSPTPLPPLPETEIEEPAAPPVKPPRDPGPDFETADPAIAPPDVAITLHGTATERRPAETPAPLEGPPIPRRRWARRAVLAALVMALAATGVLAFLRSGRSDDPPQSLVAGPIAPGRYVTPSFTPAVTFTVSDGWDTTTVGSDDFVEFTRRNRDDQRVSVMRVQRVYDREVPQTSVDEMRRAVKSVPPDLADWLQSHPRRTSQEAPIQVSRANRVARELNAEFSPFSYPGCETLENRCVILFQRDPRPGEQRTTAFARTPNERTRFQVFVIDSAQVVVATSSRPEDFAEFVALADRLLTIEMFGNTRRVTTAGLTTQPNPSRSGDSVTFAVEIGGSCGPTGTVTIHERSADGKVLTQITLDNGRGSDRVPVNGVDMMPIVVVYEGSADCAKGISVPVLQRFNPP